MKKVNEWFVCKNCEKNIPPATKTCRNHCPNCFVSIHIDENIPWDRASCCWWFMYPTTYLLSNGKMKILFVCVSCLHEHRNKSCEDDKIWDIDYFINHYKKNYI